MPFDIPNTKFDGALAYSCVSLWFFVFGIFILSVEATNGLFLIFLIACPLLTYLAIMKVAIPQPNEAIVTEVLGRNICPEFDSEDVPVNNPNEDECEHVLMNVIAHRFAGLDAPENTIEALDLCHKNGGIGAEFDLVLTKDLIPIIFHDVYLDRVTMSSGEIQNKTWEELKKLDVSVNHPFHERFKESNIPLFDDVIQKIIQYDMRIFIDIKDDRPEITNIILQTFKKYPVLYRRAAVSSFNFWIIYAIRKQDPNIVASMAWRPHYMSYCKYSPREEDCIPYSNTLIIYCYSRLLDHLTTWLFKNICVHLVGFSVALLHKDVITPEVVTYWKEKNVRVIAWTVNRPSEKLHLLRDLGVAYMTDSMIGN